jgi:hypothetical protein
VVGKKAPAAAPRKRVSSTPVGQRPDKQRRDWWPWNLMAGLVVVILGTGVVVWGLRTLIASTAVAPTPLPVATAQVGLPTRPPAEGSPVTSGVPTPTLSAPDALNNGPYAAVTQIASTVGTADQKIQRPILPPEVPAPHIVFSTTEHDWGQIAASGIVSQVITVANPGNRPLVIDQLLSNCSCLSGSISSNSLPVGSRATLVVLYDPGLDGQKGLVTRTLTVLSTAGDTPVKELTFKATIP